MKKAADITIPTITSLFKTIIEPVTSFSEDMKVQFETAKTQEERGCILHNKYETDLKASKAERERLSEQLLLVMNEFHTLGNKPKLRNADQ